MDFQQVGKLYKLQKEAKKIKKELAKTHIFAKENGVKVTVSGEMEILNVEFYETDILGDQSALAEAFKLASNRAFKKAQEVAAQQMKSIMGDMQGLMGGDAPA